jgi:hypothetical protein
VVGQAKPGSRVIAKGLFILGSHASVAPAVEQVVTADVAVGLACIRRWSCRRVGAEQVGEALLRP